MVEKPAKEETVIENATPDYAAGLVSTQVGLPARASCGQCAPSFPDPWPLKCVVGEYLHIYIHVCIHTCVVCMHMDMHMRQRWLGDPRPVCAMLHVLASSGHEMWCFARPLPCVGDRCPPPGAPVQTESSCGLRSFPIAQLSSPPAVRTSSFCRVVIRKPLLDFFLPSKRADLAAP